MRRARRSPGYRTAVVLGLHRGGLALARALGRSGVPVHGISWDDDAGTRTRYVTQLHRTRVAYGGERDLETLAILQRIANDRRLVLLPDNDDGVEFVLAHWDLVREIADVPLPDPQTVQSLRRKELLPETAARAGIATPRTASADSEEAIRNAGLRPPLLVKPVEGKVFVSIYGEKLFLAETVDDAVAGWRRASARGVETVVQELIPDAEGDIYSLFTYIARRGEPLASVVGRKVRQLPVRFGSSTVFESCREPKPLELGLALLESVGYRGFAHVEFALDRRDGSFSLIEVNTRIPVWGGIGARRRFDIASAAYRDLCGLHVDALGVMTDTVRWIDLRRDITAFVRTQDRHLGEFLAPYLTRRKARAYFAIDDPAPAAALGRAAGRRLLTKLGDTARRSPSPEELRRPV
ncbi:MAG TPA: hypothetical protein VIL77_16660 [Gaiellaceae bacterium]